MEPIPPLTKERQRTINNGISPLSDSIVLSESNLTSANANTGNFASKGKRQRPQCTHCGLQGHSIDKCYKLHGYPPGYKPKLHNALGHAHTNQASILSNDSTPSESMLGNLSSTQCQQLIALLSSQLQWNSTALMESQPQESPSVSCFSGKVILSSSISHIPISSYSWVLDTGATHHVCCSLILFKTSSLSHNSTVSLPNGHSVVVTRVGSVELFDRFIIENILYVHSFISIFFLLVPSLNIITAQCILYLNLVLFRTVCKGRWLGWVDAVAITMFWILPTFFLYLLVSQLFVIMSQRLNMSFGISVWVILLTIGSIHWKMYEISNNLLATLLIVQFVI